MSLTITLDDALVAGLEDVAKHRQLSVEQFAISVLSDAVEAFVPVSPREVVTRIQATATNPPQVRPATAKLADALRTAPGDPSFDLGSWQRQWSVAEAELTASTRASDLAEGRGA